MADKNQYLSVSALSAYLKLKFDADPYLGKVYLTGEISNLGNRRGRHLYFSIKDPEGQAVIKAAMFSYASRLKFNPEEGMKVLAIGRVQLYEPNGSYSIILDEMKPDGIGELFLAYEQLKQRLQQEGVFSHPKKRLPNYPKKIAVVTSPTGAVIEDIAKTVARRFPKAQVVLFPAIVQGDQAAPSMIKQLNRIDGLDFDVLIIGRGGGSIEDLWAFNDEALVRRISELSLPVISSVGHETDNTLTDLVADCRAATPTAAAELATPINQQQLKQHINDLQNRLLAATSQTIRQRQIFLDQLVNRPIMRQPDRLYTVYQQRVDGLYERMVRVWAHRLQVNRNQLSNLRQRQEQLGRHLLQPQQEKLAMLATKLNLVSPLTILGRGYAIVQKDNATIVHSIKDLKVADEVDLRLADGQVRAEITGVENDRSK
ncbi:exodeoxyribonuclease VII large subunit [Convivina praedatoris]|uniref:Exodeoxyribonuclease 7 large subunit n=1 Tax=Convivina praedatoris TaxID=2880963 RepID=A0ABN8H728_9LACO|nr:exodeoxyribonuclease VII large subunit [Convivina sp. LMG 32447]CAH1850530.1 Exodeoxyribonuclease 7 large subunit [Convivina sp. LMG 32447]CAH1850538.1 Exodeoxyribonuclease 7 large subunit [Convivina sp. LMG 32447]CAH1850672.1 Exodeoxyribonuclease 7 large subunit [Convivina sp. LMG 32447]